MKHYLKTITWKFSDCTTSYPDISDTKIYIRAPDDVIKYFRFLFKDEVKERFVVLWLNAANRVTGWEIISEGILNSRLVHPREVFRGAIVATCASVIIAHNHPSGNPEPSTDDIAITKQVVEAGKIIGIPVHDHIIFAEDNHTSLAERGLI
jgi:DNA repair protein RadC